MAERGDVNEHAPTSSRVCLAPLRGVTDAVFRQAYASFFSGVDWAITPFLTTTRGPRVKPSQLKEVLPENNTSMAVTPQVLSKTADHFLVLAEALFQLGYGTVNWNLGCPYPMVARKGRGSGMLHRPEAIESFLECVVPAMSGRLSIKMRLGRFAPDEILRVLPILNRFDLREIIIHPRTGVQMYSGRPDLDAFDRCLAMTHHKVVYNGDIVDLPSFHALRRRFPSVEEWMIGRGAIVNPFLPGLIKGNRYEPKNAFACFKDFHDTLYRLYRRKLFGPSHLINRMKGLWAYFAKAFRDGDKVRKKINKTTKTAHYEGVVNAYFNAAPQWRASLFETAPESRGSH